jgi:hypothetical protein
VASWGQRVSECRRTAEVVELCRQYLTSFDDQEIATIPEPCRAVRLVAPADVQEYAYLLARHGCAEPNWTVDRLRGLFTHASRMIALLAETSLQSSTEEEDGA